MNEQGKDEPEGLINKSKLWAFISVDKDFDDAGLSVTAFRVYVHLCRRADTAHVAWPGIRSISENCRINHETAIRALRELEARGFVKIVKEWGRRSNYEILPKHCWKPADRVLKPTSRKEGLGPKTDDTVRKEDTPVVGNRERKVYHLRYTKEGNPPNPPGARARAREAREKLAADVSVVSLPLFLSGDDFRQALQRWIDHRKMLRKPMTQWALELVIKKCEKWGKEAAIANINYSIGRAWQDVFAPRAEPPPPKDKGLLF
jgi:hypothetical protein